MTRAYLALLGAMASWGLSVTLSDKALATLTPADVLLAEVVAGTAAVALVVWIRRLRRGPRPLIGPTAGTWRGALLLGVLEPGATYLFALLGLARTTAATGSLLLSLESVFVVLLAWVFLRERLRPIEWVALALGMSGAAAVSVAQTGGGSSLSGSLLLILAAFAAALYFLAARARAEGVDPLDLVLKQGIGAMTIAGPYAVWSWARDGSGFPAATVGTWLLALACGVVAFSIPFVLYLAAVPHVRPAVAAVALNLIPVVGVASAALLGRGAPSLPQLAGGALILAGLGLLTRAELRENSSEPTYQGSLPAL